MAESQMPDWRQFRYAGQGVQSVNLVSGSFESRLRCATDMPRYASRTYRQLVREYVLQH